jgi:hypothetical protein
MFFSLMCRNIKREKTVSLLYRCTVMKMKYNIKFSARFLVIYSYLVISVEKNCDEGEIVGAVLLNKVGLTTKLMLFQS